MTTLKPGDYVDMEIKANGLSYQISFLVATDSYTRKRIFKRVAVKEVKDYVTN